MSKRLRAVEVDWIDSATRNGWGSGTEHASSGPLRCRTAGYLLRNNKTVCVVIQSTTESGQVGESITIPASCVLRVRRLR